ncbi:MAG: DUF2378 family protein [Myxococcota bacterium]
MSERVVFSHTIEGLFVQALGARVTPELKARLKSAGLNLDAKLLPAYPFEVWMKVLELTCQALFPDLPTDQAMFRVGESFLDGYQHTFLGRAVLGMIRVLGPRRTLLRSTQNFRSGNNYTETKITEVDVNIIDLWMNEVGPWPTFTAGIIHAALKAAGAEPRIDILDHDGHACTYRVSWATPKKA